MQIDDQISAMRSLQNAGEALRREACITFPSTMAQPYSPRNAKRLDGPESPAAWQNAPTGLGLSTPGCHRARSRSAPSRAAWRRVRCSERARSRNGRAPSRPRSHPSSRCSSRSPCPYGVAVLEDRSAANEPDTGHQALDDARQARAVGPGYLRTDERESAARDGDEGNAHRPADPTLVARSHAIGSASTRAMPTYPRFERIRGRSTSDALSSTTNSSSNRRASSGFAAGSGTPFVRIAT